MTYADYKNQAADDLRSYNSLKVRAGSLNRQISLYRRLGASVSTDSAAENHCGGKDISPLETLENELKTITFRIACIDAALDCLEDADRDLLRSFYISRQRNTINNLARKSYTDRSCLYRRAQKALDRYVYVCYGVQNTQ